MRTAIRCPVKACAFAFPSDSKCPVHGNDDQRDSMAAATEQLGADLATTPPGDRDRDSRPNPRTPRLESPGRQ
jgi:hypothetical protein